MKPFCARGSEHIQVAIEGSSQSKLPNHSHREGRAISGDSKIAQLLIRYPLSLDQHGSYGSDCRGYSSSYRVSHGGCMLHMSSAQHLCSLATYAKPAWSLLKMTTEADPSRWTLDIKKPKIVVAPIDSDMDGVISTRYRTWYRGKYQKLESEECEECGGEIVFGGCRPNTPLD